MHLGKKIPIIQRSSIKDTDGNITVSGAGWYDSEKPDKVTKRYLLKINIEKINDKNTTWRNCLNVIMFNPSQAGIDIEDGQFVSKGEFFVDKTITNVIKIAKDNNYNKINILNLFSEIQPNSKKVNISDEKIFSYLIDFIDKNDVLLAWGTIRDNKRIKSIKKSICDKLINKKIKIYTFCANENRVYPKHPANIDIECCRHCWERNGLAKLEDFNNRANKIYEK